MYHECHFSVHTVKEWLFLCLIKIYAFYRFQCNLIAIAHRSFNVYICAFSGCKVIFVCVLSHYNITTIFQVMEVQLVGVRVSECIDDLGQLLDLLYKFPQKQREGYFEKIQSMKNRLLLLRSGLREGNAHQTEKQYKQIYLAMNTLKNEIMQQNTVLCAKENRDAHNRKDIKEAKRNYDDAMRLIVQRDEEIRLLKQEVFEKEELLQTNFAEINRMKDDLQLLIQDNRRLKYEHTSLQLDLDTLRAALDRGSDTAIEFKIREQEKDKAFSAAVEELERLKVELISANQKLSHFQQLAEISIKKTRQVEENIKKVERQAQDLNDNYRIRENDNFRKLREMGELQFELANRVEQVRQLDLQNRRLREDVEVLQNEIGKLNRSACELRMQANEEKEKLHAEQKRLLSEIDNGSVREGELRRLLQEGEKKYLLVIAKLNAAEELKSRNRELQIKSESLEERVRRTEGLLQEAKKDSIQTLREKERVGEQMEAQARGYREMEIECLKLREKLKVREQERARFLNEVEAWQGRVREGEKAAAVHEMAVASLQSQLVEERTKVIKTEEKHRIKDKQIETLKIKLLQAKIQTVHEIRQVINA